jgi:hypothetical protein
MSTKRLVLLVAFLALVMACSGDDAPVPSDTTPPSSTPARSAKPTPTATQPPPSPEPTPTATTVPELPAAFRDFVRDEVAPALAAGDLAFFAQHAVTEPIVCVPDNTPSLPGGPNCQMVGDKFDGFVFGNYRSELFVVPIGGAFDWLRRLMMEEAPGASEEFGSAMRRIYAIGVPPASWVIEDGHSSLVEGEHYATVLTAIIDAPTVSEGGNDDPTRLALSLHWLQQGGSFRLGSIIRGGSDILEFGPDSWPLWEPHQP